MAGRPLHLSAASGLVCLHSFIYVVSDDELHLGVFGRADRKPGHLIRLFDGALADSKSDRKKQKPDLEALTLLPAYGRYHHGALLALGSGSKRNRRLGALLGLDAHGAVHGAPRVIDLSPLLAPLEEEFAALNIEGAVVSGDELRLFSAATSGIPRTPSYDTSFQLCSMRGALGEQARSSHPPSIRSISDRSKGFHYASRTRRRCQMATWYSPPSQRIPTTPITMDFAWARPSGLRATTELCVACDGSTGPTKSKAWMREWTAMS